MPEFRNIAIIAHVDHGKTTLVDALLQQSGTYEEHQQIETRVMDSHDQEKERGITIYAKNTSYQYKNCKVNIIDTPGHADFGSEVERVLRMIDSVILVVDSYEGPMPQTKFVLSKSLALGLNPIVVINKVDKPSARCDWVINELFDLFVKLDATDEQLDFPICYTIATEGKAGNESDNITENIQPLFELIMQQVSPAKTADEAPLKMQVTNLAYDNFLGRMAIGRIYQGTVNKNDRVTVIKPDGTKKPAKISEVLVSLGLARVKVPTAYSGDVVIIAGISDIYVGDTIVFDAKESPMPSINIDEPTLKMAFMVNSSPFAGKEGKLLTSRQIRERLERELETNIGMSMDFSDPECFIVCGRGELHLAVLVESMRREGFELQIGTPQVIYQFENNKRLEPIERVSISLPSEFAGNVIAEMGKRKGDMLNLQEHNGSNMMEYFIPTRGLLGFKSQFTTLTKGEGILTSVFEKYEPYKGDIEHREVGSLICSESGTAMAFSLWKLQERGPLFIDPAIPVYEGMIIGEHLKGSDLNVNPTKNKKLTNVRASGKDDALNLVPPRKLGLEEAIDYIGDDEFVEVTPSNIRLRKKYLKESERRHNNR
jgi:GTP-binding protein